MNDGHFFDSRTHKLLPNQVMACYAATAYLGDSEDKKQLISLLRQKDGVNAAIGYMENVFRADADHTIVVPKAILQDMMNGFTDEQILQKEYKYTINVFYNVEPEHVPDDPHWQICHILNKADYAAIKKIKQSNI